MQYSNGTVIDNRIWSVELSTSSLVRICLLDGQTAVIEKLSEECEELMYEKIEKIDEHTLLIAPFYADDFIIYDIREKSLHRINIAWEGLLRASDIRERKIGKMIIAEGIVYAIGFSFMGVIRMNLSDFSYDIINCVGYCSPYPETGYYRFTYKSGMKKGDKLYLPLAMETAVLEVSLSDSSVKRKDVAANVGLVSVCSCGEDIYCLDDKGNLIRLDENSRVSIIDEEEDCPDNTQAYTGMEAYDHYIYLIPYGAKNFVRYDVENGEKVVLQRYLENDIVKHVDYFKSEERIYAFQFKRQSFVEVPLSESRDITIKKCIPPVELLYYLKENPTVIREGEITLEEFLKLNLLKERNLEHGNKK